MAKIILSVEEELKSGLSDRTLSKLLMETLKHNCPRSVKIRLSTPTQVISGYHRPVCKKCQVELRPETNGVGLLDFADWGPYEIYDADLWKCPVCGVEIVGGFASDAISHHYDAGFENMIKSYEEKGLLVKNIDKVD